jgi:hypothetical protein
VGTGGALINITIQDMLGSEDRRIWLASQQGEVLPSPSGALMGLRDSPPRPPRSQGHDSILASGDIDEIRKLYISGIQAILMSPAKSRANNAPLERESRDRVVEDPVPALLGEVSVQETLSTRS